MQPLSPSIDRIGAALKALRRAHEHDATGEDKLSLGAKCLHAVIAQLTEEGIPPEDLQPLIDLEATLDRLKGRRQGPVEVADRRKRRPPSDVLLARASAVIDLLIKAGHEESEAAQMIMLEWRVGILCGTASQVAQEEYRTFTRQIDAIPANERVKRVMDEQLWDRRRKAD